MGLVVVTVPSGGWPVVEGTGGYPVAESPNGIGFPVTKVAGKFGMPVTYVVGAVAGVASQTLEFGRLTLAGAGGIAPTATGGVISGASITSGTNANHWTMAGNGVITPSATGVSAGLAATPYVFNCTFTVGATSGITATITIATLANTYSVSNDSDWTSFLALSAATTSGKTVMARTATFAASYPDRAWTTETTLTKHTGASPIFQLMQINANNMTVDGIEFYQDSTANMTLVLVYGGATGVKIKNCKIHGHHVNPLIFYTSPQTLVNGIGTTTGGVGSLIVEDTEIYDVYRGISLYAVTSILVQRCYLHHNHTDTMNFAGMSGLPFYTLTVLDCDMWVICNVLGDHGDAIQMMPGDATPGNWPIDIRRNRIIVTNPLGTDPYWWQEQGGQGIFASNANLAGQYLTGTIEGNFVGTNAAASIYIPYAASMVVRNNTCISSEASAWAAHNAYNGGSQVNLLIGDPGTTTGTHVLSNNVAEFYAAGGTPTLSNNVPLGKQGVTNSYPTQFDGIGGNFTPATIDEGVRMFAPKTTGLLNASPTVGALKLGAIYNDWSTVPSGAYVETITPGAIPITGASITPVLGVGGGTTTVFSVTLSGSDTGYGGYTTTDLLSAANMAAATGQHARVTIKFALLNTGCIARASIGQASGGAHVWDATALTPLTGGDFGSGTYTHAGAAGPVVLVSDWVLLNEAYDETKSYIVRVFGDLFQYNVYKLAGNNQYFNFGDDTANAVVSAQTGNNVGFSSIVQTIEIQT